MLLGWCTICGRIALRDVASAEVSSHQLACRVSVGSAWLVSMGSCRRTHSNTRQFALCGQPCKLPSLHISALSWHTTILHIDDWALQVCTSYGHADGTPFTCSWYSCQQILPEAKNPSQWTLATTSGHQHLCMQTSLAAQLHCLAAACLSSSCAGSSMASL